MKANGGFLQKRRIAGGKEEMTLLTLLTLLTPLTANANNVNKVNEVNEVNKVLELPATEGAAP